jgi:hypothetical protein
MENSVMCHYINSKTSEDNIEKMLKEFKNQGWNFVSIYSNSGHNMEGYLFQLIP